MKKGSKADYFDAQITDGEAQLRVVEEHHKRLAEFEEHIQTVSLLNCQVKKLRKSEDLEILLHHKSHVEKSPQRNYRPDIDILATNSTNRLSEIPLRKAHDRVSVMAKDVKVKQPVHVSGGLTKQDIIIADETGRATLTLWESDVETVTANLLYHFNNIIVREYQENKYLSLPKKDALISNIPDFGDVSEEGPQ